MIQAIVFDLDGTLVQSERLKAQTYAVAVQRLRGLSEPDPEAIEAYRTIVGASREVVTQFIIDKLGLEPDLRPLLEEYGKREPGDVLTEIRTGIRPSGRGCLAPSASAPGSPRRRRLSYPAPSCCTCRRYPGSCRLR